MTAARDAIIDAAVYLTIHELGEVSLDGLAFRHRYLARAVLEASLARLADAGLAATTAEGRWTARPVTA